jgi:hypothetical protein
MKERLSAARRAVRPPSRSPSPRTAPADGPQHDKQDKQDKQPHQSDQPDQPDQPDRPDQRDQQPDDLSEERDGRQSGPDPDQQPAAAEPPSGA